MIKSLTFLLAFVTQSSFAAVDYTSIRVFPGFSQSLTDPDQVEKMQFDCILRDQSTLTGSVIVDPQDSQKLQTDFKYKTAQKLHELSTAKGNIRIVDISLGEQVSRYLGRGPQPWIWIQGDQWQSLILNFYFWFGNFKMVEKEKTITLTSLTAPFSYVDRPVFDDMPGQCTWVIYLK